MDNDKCPDCKRQKAHSVHDVLVGWCPKWWAIRDQEAINDCIAHNKSKEDTYKHPITGSRWTK